MTQITPHDAVNPGTDHPRLPEGDDERFAGYGAMGVPYASGHYLALRDMQASSVGPAYRSVWHRDPRGHWTMFSTTRPEWSCARYFGMAVDAEQASAIEVAWEDDWTAVVTMDDRLSWRLELAATPATQLLTAMGSAMPDSAWTSDLVLGSMSPMVRTFLHAGRIRLRGTVPNGQHFQAAPLKVWRVVGGHAQLDGADLGPLGRLTEQTQLGDFWLPQAGLFFVGRARFQPDRSGSADEQSTIGDHGGQLPTAR